MGLEVELKAAADKLKAKVKGGARITCSTVCHETS